MTLLSGHKELITYLEEHSAHIPQKSLDLYSHILNAHHLWNCRILGIDRRYEVWQKHEIARFKDINEENLRITRRILQEYDLNKKVAYTTTKGDPFVNMVRDILFHVINHSSYHRGQIAMNFRQNEIDPLISDFIYKIRN